ncbi:nuclear transport factor 2 family protein [Fodinibius sediminis]|uniref:SnoaL-like domain-containing protein n=1 Tax=Fodinibius sediminis TaxID=1214077 RepID=A0A521BJN0_9BACT|nr:nuclear transport factor 2 family protein [Fodinibius sediminis]SMO47305.1 SnoaL-like domain-containing protein [Fodinibius sediminis]
MPAISKMKNEIRATIEQFFTALDKQEFKLMNNIIAHDTEMVHIGTDRDEIWKGWQVLRTATVEQFKELEYYDADIKNLQINLSDTGQVAWYAHLLDARIKSNGREHRWLDARFTGVLEKRNGQWVLVQTHVSLPEAKQTREQ